MQSLVDTFDPAYAVSDVVVGSILADATEFVLLNLYSGTQIRIDNGANTTAGLRMGFTVDEELLAALLAEHATVSFGTEILVGGEVKATLAFDATADGEEIGYTGTNTVGAKEPVAAIITDNGDGTATYVYTVAYEGEDDYENEFTVRRFIVLDGETYTVDVSCSVFGSEFSAAEVYGYFAENGYEDDAVVQSVLSSLK